MRFKNSFNNRLVFKYELAMYYTRFLILTFLPFQNFLGHLLVTKDMYFYLLMHKDFIIIIIILIGQKIIP